MLLGDRAQLGMMVGRCLTNSPSPMWNWQQGKGLQVCLAMVPLLPPSPRDGAGGGLCAAPPCRAGAGHTPCATEQ